ncbi:MAG: N-acetylmuramoyl-L-alanine amidase [Clostridia bacterium]|nr:N-acetylmuramoyl-L-alanine amidase [Clostridia bacterium]
MKKTLVWTLTFIIFGFSVLTSGVFAADFPDVPQNHLNYDAISSLTEKGVIAGYEDFTFRPEREITRTEFCALMARTLGYDKDTYVLKDIPFGDVAEDYWGRAYISFCFEKGLINGMEEGVFAPADKVTVAQATKMAVCAVGKGDEALRVNGEKWYSGYMSLAADMGFLASVTQKADENAARSNVAQIVYNMLLSGSLGENEKGDSFDENKKDDVLDETPEETTREELSDEELSEIERVFAEKDFSDVKVILVDAGHNYQGKDIGAENLDYDIREEEITWRIADKLRKHLEAMGYQVVMTRKKMTDSIANSSALDSLQARVDLAHTSFADLFISIHCNIGNGVGTGTETYCFQLGGYSARLAALVQDKISESTGLYDRGVKTANFFVTKNTIMPSILIETGFMDNDNDMKILATEDGQEKIAEAIADAVWDYDMMEPLQIDVAEEEDNDEEA